MSDDKPHFCPRCRSPRDDVMRLTTFSCGSRVDPRWESSECLRRRIVILEQENADLVERVKRLEEAGDVLEVRDDCHCGEFVCNSCRNASEAWTKAKATQ
jgi:hypothetical protein